MRKRIPIEYKVFGVLFDFSKDGALEYPKTQKIAHKY